MPKAAPAGRPRRKPAALLALRRPARTSASTAAARRPAAAARGRPRRGQMRRRSAAAASASAGRQIELELPRHGVVEAVAQRRRAWIAAAGDDHARACGRRAGSGRLFFGQRRGELGGGLAGARLAEGAQLQPVGAAAADRQRVADGAGLVVLVADQRRLGGGLDRAALLVRPAVWSRIMLGRRRIAQREQRAGAGGGQIGVVARALGRGRGGRAAPAWRAPPPAGDSGWSPSVGMTARASAAEAPSRDRAQARCRGRPRRDRADSAPGLHRNRRRRQRLRAGGGGRRGWPAGGGFAAAAGGGAAVSADPARPCHGRFCSAAASSGCARRRLRRRRSQAFAPATRRADSASNGKAGKQPRRGVSRHPAAVAIGHAVSASPSLSPPVVSRPIRRPILARIPILV